MTDPMQNSEHRYNIALVVYGAFASTLLIYGLVSYLAIAKTTETIVTQNTPLRTVFLMLAMGAVGSSASLKRILILMGKRNPPKDNLTHPLLIPSIVSWTLCEVPALLGLVLVFQTRQFSSYLPFALISFVGFIYHFPNKQDWNYDQNSAS